MFYYEDNGKLSQSGEIQRKVVTEVRNVTYINPGKATKELKNPEPILTSGYEIVKEIVASPGFVCVPKVVGSKTVSNLKEVENDRN